MNSIRALGNAKWFLSIYNSFIFSLLLCDHFSTIIWIKLGTLYLTLVDYEFNVFFVLKVFLDEILFKIIQIKTKENRLIIIAKHLIVFAKTQFVQQLAKWWATCPKCGKKKNIRLWNSIIQTENLFSCESSWNYQVWKISKQHHRKQY